jgi:hypothetical protein
MSTDWSTDKEKTVGAKSHAATLSPPAIGTEKACIRGKVAVYIAAHPVLAAALIDVMSTDWSTD